MMMRVVALPMSLFLGCDMTWLVSDGMMIRGNLAASLQILSRSLIIRVSAFSVYQDRNATVEAEERLLSTLTLWVILESK